LGGASTFARQSGARPLHGKGTEMNPKPHPFFHEGCRLRLVHFGAATVTRVTQDYRAKNQFICYVTTDAGERLILSLAYANAHRVVA
jgi:hypothetical protein